MQVLLDKCRANGSALFSGRLSIRRPLVVQHGKNVGGIDYSSIISGPNMQVREIWARTVRVGTSACDGHWSADPVVGDGLIGLDLDSCMRGYSMIQCRHEGQGTDDNRVTLPSIDLETIHDQRLVGNSIGLLFKIIDH
jgi:hypothetical protein